MSIKNYYLLGSEINETPRQAESRSKGLLSELEIALEELEKQRYNYDSVMYNNIKNKIVEKARNYYNKFLV